MTQLIKPKPIIRLHVQETKICCGSGRSNAPAVDNCCAPASDARKDQFQNKKALPLEDASKVRYRIEKMCCPTEERLIRNRLEPMEGITRLEWLRTGLRSKKPHGIEDHLTKIRFLKELGAQQLDLGLPEAVLVALSLPISTRKTARLGRLSSANMLALACFVRLTFLRLNDQGLTMLDHRIADLWRQARTRAEASDALALRRLRHRAGAGR